MPFPDLGDTKGALVRAIPLMLFLALGSAQSRAQGGADPADQSAPAPQAMPAGAVGGMGDVNIFPKRVVINDRQRVVSIGLYNRGTGPSDYEISLADRMMTEDGQLLDLASVEDPAQRAAVSTASAMLRWSPRRVVLQGNDSQTVRVMARLPEGLPAGEYRSHFIATAIPPGGDGSFSIDDAAGATQETGIGVRIVPRFGISIPVIVRVGETTLAVAIRDVKLVALPQGEQGISFTITRSGTRSAFGDIEVAAPGSKSPVALLRGIGVYTEIGQRHVTIPLLPDANPALYRSGARLTVTYRDDDFAPGQLLAKQDYIVP